MMMFMFVIIKVFNHHCVNFLRKTLGSLKLVGFHIRLCGPGSNLIISLQLFDISNHTPEKNQTNVWAR